VAVPAQFSRAAVRQRNLQHEGSGIHVQIVVMCRTAKSGERAGRIRQRTVTRCARACRFPVQENVVDETTHWSKPASRSCSRSGMTDPGPPLSDTQYTFSGAKRDAVGTPLEQQIGAVGAPGDRRSMTGDAQIRGGDGVRHGAASTPMALASS